MGFVFFSLAVVVLALSARSETASAFNRDVIKNRHQLMLYGISLLMIILPVKLNFLQSFLGLTEITGNQWLICIGFAFALLLVDEVIKFFMRRSRSQRQQAKIENYPRWLPAIDQRKYIGTNPKIGRVQVFCGAVDAAKHLHSNNFGMDT